MNSSRDHTHSLTVTPAFIYLQYYVMLTVELAEQCSLHCIM